jgi:hypothetical protein
MSMEDMGKGSCLPGKVLPARALFVAERFDGTIAPSVER